MGVILMIAACASLDDEFQTMTEPAPMEEAMVLGGARGGAGYGAKGVGGLAAVGYVANDGAAVVDMAPAGRPILLVVDEDDKSDLAPEEPANESSAPMRQWFPEAFLWRPSVVTENGEATLDVRVPDQLTDWRVLALAHDRAGHQAGAEHTFASVLPVSVDPVVPGWLYVGDEVVVPSRASALGTSFTGRMVVEASGALSGGTSGAINLQSGASRSLAASIVAERSGAGTLSAELFAVDRVDGAVRPIDVRPVGRAIETVRGGVLSGSRSLSLEHPGAIEERVVVRVFPGPLAVFQAEVDRIGSRPSGAYAYGVIAGIRALSETSGIAVDEEQLRTLRIRAWQDLVHAARRPDGPATMALLTSLVVPDDDALAVTTRDRLVDRLENAQFGDGTWNAASRSTVQHLIVQTAASARVLPVDSKGPRLRAAGALERLLPNVDDPYTAAWVLASGVVDPSLRADLEAMVLEGVDETPDGRHVLKALPRVMGPYGRVTQTEHLAVTWLALQSRTDLDWRGDLLAELIQLWSPASGLRGGWADGLALAAIRAGLPSLSAPVKVEVEHEGKNVGVGTLDPMQPNVPVVMEVAGGGDYTVRSVPAVPGLVFVASHTAWIPFTGDEGLPGVEVEVTATPLVVGREGMLRLSIAAPSGMSVSVVQGLPAGTVASVRSVSALMKHSVTEDQVRFTTRAFGAGEVLEIEVAVTPQFAGAMNTRPLEISVGEKSRQVQPFRWRVASR